MTTTTTAVDHYDLKSKIRTTFSGYEFSKDEKRDELIEYLVFKAISIEFLKMPRVLPEFYGILYDAFGLQILSKFFKSDESKGNEILYSIYQQFYTSSTRIKKKDIFISRIYSPIEREDINTNLPEPPPTIKSIQFLEEDASSEAEKIYARMNQISRLLFTFIWNHRLFGEEKVKSLAIARSFETPVIIYPKMRLKKRLLMELSKLTTHESQIQLYYGKHFGMFSTYIFGLFAFCLRRGHGLSKRFLKLLLTYLALIDPCFWQTLMDEHKDIPAGYKKYSKPVEYNLVFPDEEKKMDIDEPEWERVIGEKIIRKKGEEKKVIPDLPKFTSKPLIEVDTEERFRNRISILISIFPLYIRQDYFYRKDIKYALGTNLVEIQSFLKKLLSKSHKLLKDSEELDSNIKKVNYQLKNDNLILIKNLKILLEKIKQLEMNIVKYYQLFTNLPNDYIFERIKLMENFQFQNFIRNIYEFNNSPNIYLKIFKQLKSYVDAHFIQFKREFQPILIKIELDSLKEEQKQKYQNFVALVYGTNAKFDTLVKEVKQKAEDFEKMIVYIEHLDDRSENSEEFTFFMDDEKEKEFARKIRDFISKLNNLNNDILEEKAGIEVYHKRIMKEFIPIDTKILKEIFEGAPELEKTIKNLEIYEKGWNEYKIRYEKFLYFEKKLREFEFEFKQLEGESEKRRDIGIQKRKNLQFDREKYFSYLNNQHQKFYNGIKDFSSKKYKDKQKLIVERRLKIMKDWVEILKKVDNIPQFVKNRNQANKILKKWRLADLDSMMKELEETTEILKDPFAFEQWMEEYKLDVFFSGGDPFKSLTLSLESSSQVPTGPPFRILSPKQRCKKVFAKWINDIKIHEDVVNRIENFQKTFIDTIEFMPVKFQERSSIYSNYRNRQGNVLEKMISDIWNKTIYNRSYSTSIYKELPLWMNYYFTNDEIIKMDRGETIKPKTREKIVSEMEEGFTHFDMHTISMELMFWLESSYNFSQKPKRSTIRVEHFVEEEGASLLNMDDVIRKYLVVSEESVVKGRMRSILTFMTHLNEAQNLAMMLTELYKDIRESSWRFVEQLKFDKNFDNYFINDPIVMMVVVMICNTKHDSSNPAGSTQVLLLKKLNLKIQDGSFSQDVYEFCYEVMGVLYKNSVFRTVPKTYVYSSYLFVQTVLKWFVREVLQRLKMWEEKKSPPFVFTRFENVEDKPDESFFVTVKTREKDLKKSQQQLQENRQQLQENQQQLQESQQEFQKSQKQLQENRQELQENKQELQKNNQKLRSTTNEYLSIVNQNKINKSKFKKKEAELKTFIEKFKEHIRILNINQKKNLRKLSDEMGDLKKFCEENVSKMKRLKDINEKIIKELSKKEQELIKKENELGELEKNKLDLQNEFISLKKDFQQNVVLLKSCKENLKINRDKLNAKEQEVLQTKKELEEKKKELVENKEQLFRTSFELVKKKKELKESEEELKESENKNFQLKINKEELEEEVFEQKSIIDNQSVAHGVKLEELNMKLEQKKKQLEESKEELDKTEGDKIKKLREDLEKRKRDIKQNEDKILILEEGKVKRSEERANLTEKSKKLSSKIVDLKTRVEKLEEEKDILVNKLKKAEIKIPIKVILSGDESSGEESSGDESSDDESSDSDTEGKYLNYNQIDTEAINLYRDFEPFCKEEEEEEEEAQGEMDVEEEGEKEEVKIVCKKHKINDSYSLVSHFPKTLWWKDAKLVKVLTFGVKERYNHEFLYPLAMLMMYSTPKPLKKALGNKKGRMQFKYKIPYHENLAKSLTLKLDRESIFTSRQLTKLKKYVVALLMHSSLYVGIVKKLKRGKSILSKSLARIIRWCMSFSLKFLNENISDFKMKSSTFVEFVKDPTLRKNMNHVKNNLRKLWEIFIPIFKKKINLNNRKFYNTFISFMFDSKKISSYFQRDYYVESTGVISHIISLRKLKKAFWVTNPQAMADMMKFQSHHNNIKNYEQMLKTKPNFISASTFILGSPLKSYKPEHFYDTEGGFSHYRYKFLPRMGFYSVVPFHREKRSTPMIRYLAEIGSMEDTIWTQRK